MDGEDRLDDFVRWILDRHAGLTPSQVAVLFKMFEAGRTIVVCGDVVFVCAIPITPFLS